MYTYSDRVSYSKVGPDGYLTKSAMMNYFQDTSTFQSEDGGAGLDYLFERGLGWFVTNYDIHIHRLPKMGEYVKLITIPYSLRGMLGQRTYEIRTASDEVLVTADSLWVLMDLEKNSPARITPEMVIAYPLDEKPSYVGARTKIKELPTLKKVGEFTVGYNYLDTNSHMNNANYIELTEKFLPKGFKAGSISINFNKPAQLNDCIDVLMAQSDDGYQVVLKKEDSIYTLIEFKG